MDLKHYDIKIGTAADQQVGMMKTYTPDFQTQAAYAKGWKSALKQARAVKDDAAQRKTIQCQCNGSKTKTGECLLEVRELEGTYFLAKKKHTGMQHRDDCRFFQVDRENSGLNAYDKDVVDDDGGIKVGLGLQMQDHEPADADPAPSTLPKRRSGTKHKQVSLLGLLQILWNSAGLNYCQPNSIGSRNNIAYRLFKRAAPIKIKRQRLDKHLLVYDMSKENKKTLEFATTNNRRLFVVAPLAPWISSVESESGTLPIQIPTGIPDLALINGLWNATVRSFKRTMDAWRAGQPVMAIAQIEPQVNSKAVCGYSCQVVALALMRITSYWLPVESNYEQIIADELVETGRRFIKPLKYDADEEDVFPDFILLDTADNRGTPMEVFGMSSQDYLLRQAEKTNYYNDAFGTNGWWCWIPKNEPMHKPFPPPQ